MFSLILKLFPSISYIFDFVGLSNDITLGKVVIEEY